MKNVTIYQVRDPVVKDPKDPEQGWLRFESIRRHEAEGHANKIYRGYIYEHEKGKICEIIEVVSKPIEPAAKAAE